MKDRQKSPISPQKQQKVSPTVHSMHDSNGATVPHDVDKLLGQILEETGVVHSPGNGPINAERQTQQVLSRSGHFVANFTVNNFFLENHYNPADTPKTATLKDDSDANTGADGTVTTRRR